MPVVRIGSPSEADLNHDGFDYTSHLGGHKSPIPSFSNCVSCDERLAINRRGMCVDNTSNSSAAKRVFRLRSFSQNVNILLSKRSSENDWWVSLPGDSLRYLDILRADVSFSGFGSGWILARHPADKFPDFGRDFSPATRWPVRPPAPIQPKSCAMPTHHSLRLHDQQHFGPAGPDTA